MPLKRIDPNKTRSFILPKIGGQLVLVFFLAATIPTLILGSLTIRNARSQLMDQYQSQLKADMVRLKSTLFYMTTSVYTYFENFLSSPDTKAFFSSDKVDLADYETLTATLLNLKIQNASIDTVQIYTNNPAVPKGAYITFLPEGYGDQQWYQDLSTGIWDNWSCTSYKNSQGQEVYQPTLVRRLAIASQTYSAYLVVTLSSGYIRSTLLNNDYFILAMIDDEPSFFSSQNSWYKKEIPFPSDFHEEVYNYSGDLTIDKNACLGLISTFLPYRTGNHFYLCVADSHAYGELNQITKNYAIILILAIVVPVVLIILLSSYFSARIVTLRRAMHQARQGDYNIIDNFRGDDELADTFLDLKATVNRIHEQEALYYQAQIHEQQLINQQQEMEFKMLSSQINPHFLYNTLETIRMQALASNNREVAKSIKLLGKAMRYVLENTGTQSTTLARELDHVNVYLQIQQIRFGDRVHYSINLQDGLDPQTIQFLPLLLQPVVENAVIHGLEGVKESGCITINIQKNKSGELVIHVHDNGDGMDPQILETIQEKLRKNSLDQTSHIGLANINQRIKLMYGEEYSLEIQSSPQGTTITLILPYVEQGKE